MYSSYIQKQFKCILWYFKHLTWSGWGLRYEVCYHLLPFPPLSSLCVHKVLIRLWWLSISDTICLCYLNKSYGIWKSDFSDKMRFSSSSSSNPILIAPLRSTFAIGFSAFVFNDRRLRIKHISKNSFSIPQYFRLKISFEKITLKTWVSKSSQGIQVFFLLSQVKF